MDFLFDKNGDIYEYCDCENNSEESEESEENDKIIYCNKCGDTFEKDLEEKSYWSCCNCDKIYCNDCEESNSFYTHCYTENCIFCDNGNCWNKRLIGEVCDECYPQFKNSIDSNSNSDSESDSDNNSDNNSDSISESDEETKKIMYESLEQSILEKNFDAIEKTYGIKLNKIKKFKKRFEKESNKCEICYMRDKVCEFDCNHKTCLECFCKSYCLEKNKNCPFCKNYIGEEIMCKCV